MARIVVLATWHRRCGPYHYAQALKLLGHEVLCVGQWREEEPFGERGREPDITLPRSEPPWYAWSQVAPVDRTDQIWLIDGGEHLRLTAWPPSIPLVHISTEGSDMHWSRGVTPHRYAEIMCNGVDADVQWLPKAVPPTWEGTWDELSIAERSYDVVELYRRAFRERFRGPIWRATWDELNIEGPHGRRPERPYDVVQLASQRDSRREFAERLRGIAPDLNYVFGELWGPLYRYAYCHSLATWVCSNQDFVTSRVFEAMATSCIVFADRTPSMLSLFEDGVDFIGYDPVVGDDGEGAPDVPWFADQVRRLRREPEWRLSIARSAWQKAWTRHTMRQRCEQVLSDVRVAHENHA